MIDEDVEAACILASAPKLNPTLKGERTCAAVLAALLKKGKSVAIPFGDGRRYDLIVDDDGILKRVQCKTASPSGADGFKFNTMSHDRVKKRQSYKGQVEYFGVWYEKTDKVYLIPLEDLPSVDCGLARIRYSPIVNWFRKDSILGDKYEI